MSEGTFSFKIVTPPKPEPVLGYFVYYREICQNCENGKLRYQLASQEHFCWEEIPPAFKAEVDCNICDGTGYIVREVPLMEFAREMADINKNSKVKKKKRSYCEICD